LQGYTRLIPEPETLSAAALSALGHLFAEPAVDSVSYAGSARPDVLRLLCAEQGNRETPASMGAAAFPLYVLDLHNRYGAATEFDWDTGERAHAGRFPAWMLAADGEPRVMFSGEGAGPGKLLILDLPERMAMRAVETYPRGRSVIVLLDESRCLESLIGSFSWMRVGEMSIGRPAR